MFAQSLLAYIWWLVILGVPLSWKKSKGGLSYTWVSYELCFKSWTLGISASRAAWFEGWLTRTIDAGLIDTAELREALGRMVYMYGALQ